MDMVRLGGPCTERGEHVAPVSHPPNTTLWALFMGWGFYLCHHGVAHGCVWTRLRL